MRRYVVLCLMLVAMTGCRTAYYATMEKFGVHKRDLLKKEVEGAKNEQAKATEEFKDALTRLKDLYGFQGGDLEKVYDRMKADFDRCQSRANAVTDRMRKVEQVGGDLFKEWEQEIGSYENDRLASNSRRELQATQEKFNELKSAMGRAEASMQPVLKQFRDQVLYLKHNLNAQAIGALRNETQAIEREIEALIKEMNRSIAEADEFIKGMN